MLILNNYWRGKFLYSHACLPEIVERWQVALEFFDPYIPKADLIAVCLQQYRG